MLFCRAKHGRYLDVKDARHQAGNGEAVQLEASAEPWQQVHECIGVTNRRALLIIKSTKHPGLHIYKAPSTVCIRCHRSEQGATDASGRHLSTCFKRRGKKFDALTSQLSRGKKLSRLITPHLMSWSSSSTARFSFSASLTPTRRGRAEMPMFTAMLRLTPEMKRVSKKSPAAAMSYRAPLAPAGLARQANRLSFGETLAFLKRVLGCHVPTLSALE